MGVASRVGNGNGWGGGSCEGKWRQLYLNNNKKREKKKKLFTSCYIPGIHLLGIRGIVLAVIQNYYSLSSILSLFTTV